MKLSDMSIRRPVLASMVSLALVLFGVIGYTQLAVREFPDVDPPIVSVSTALVGANPQVIESAVTDILEEELSTVEGLRTLTSSSAEGFSNITLEFNLDRDVEAAAQDTRDKVARIRGRLPEDVEEPVVAKQDADAQPFFWLALSGENYDLLQLSDIADRLVKSRLQTLPGVGQAQIFGERRFSMRVWLSASELAARGITVQDVEAAIRSRNVEVPAGRIESERREFTVRSLGELKTPEEFGNLVVRSDGGVLIKLKDLARVELGPEDERSTLRFKGTSAVAIGVVRQSKSNIISVADAIHEEVPRIQASLPPGVALTTAFDQSTFVKISIREAEETLLIAAGLVVVIIFVFLRNLRATIIPGLAIPTSIVATFAIMYFFGFSINNFTLLALTLAIGIVVDDAIIVLENAYRHQEELGEDPETAAINGTREIAFAVLATTIALVAVFTPLAFLKGSTGRLFNEFGVAVAGSVIISGFVALTLTPMLCAKILRMPKQHGRIYSLLESGFNSLSSGYVRTLRGALRIRTAGRDRRAGRDGGSRVRVPLARARVRAARGPGLVLLVHHRARGLVARLYRRLSEACGGHPGGDAGDRQLLQRGQHRRRREPRHDLQQPEGLGRPGALVGGDHRRRAGTVLRHSRRLCLRHPAARVRLGQPGQLRHSASQTSPCW